jgi:hypothetical protein
MRMVISDNDRIHGVTGLLQLVSVFVIFLPYMHEPCRKFGRIRANPRVMLSSAADSRWKHGMMPRRMADEHHLETRTQLFLLIRSKESRLRRMVM